MRFHYKDWLNLGREALRKSVQPLKRYLADTEHVGRAAVFCLYIVLATMHLGAGLVVRDAMAIACGTTYVLIGVAHLVG